MTEKVPSDKEDYMKLVIQRVKEAKVTVEGKTVGEIY